MGSGGNRRRIVREPGRKSDRGREHSRLGFLRQHSRAFPGGVFYAQRARLRGFLRRPHRADARAGSLLHLQHRLSLVQRDRLRDRALGCLDPATDALPEHSTRDNSVVHRIRKKTGRDAALRRPRTSIKSLPLWHAGGRRSAPSLPRASH